MEFIKKLSDLGIIPVIEINDEDKTEDLVDALINGKLPCVEITFRTVAAEEAVRRVSKHSPNMIVIAGTVLTVEQVKRAIDAGANGIVSPCINRKVVDYCIRNSIPIVPGVSTPSEIDLAYQLNLRYVKLFPAEALGGIKYIKAVSEPYQMMRFMPTGGVNLANLSDYLSFNRVFAVGGSWIAKKELIDSGHFDIITKNAEKAVDIVKNIRANRIC